MRKFNGNRLLFAFAVVFVVLGFCGSLPGQLLVSTRDLMVGFSRGEENAAEAYIDKVEQISGTGLSYHNLLLDLNSIKENLLGTRILHKEDMTIVKTNTGGLSVPLPKVPDSDLSGIADRIADLQTVVRENGAEFLYCAVPAKQNMDKFPANVENFSRDNYERFLGELKKREIAYLDFGESLDMDRKPAELLYYYTDHHWQVRTGFDAAKSICETLYDMYGFSYNRDYVDIANYHVTKFQNRFLGSYGKKAGRFFTWRGADDFELITPAFNTDMTEEQPRKNSLRRGSFQDTVLYMENLEKNYYGLSTYSTYSGGDFRLQIMKNNRNPEGSKILLIRDSSANVVAPFLALQTAELHVCDIRNFPYFVGEKIQTEEYIRRIKPDYVIVLYTGIKNLEESDGLFDFLT